MSSLGEVVDKIEHMLPADNKDIQDAYERTLATMSYMAPELVDQKWATLFAFIVTEVAPLEQRDDAKHWTQELKRYWSSVVPRSAE